jgi:hypothetical protein
MSYLRWIQATCSSMTNITTNASTPINTILSSAWGDYDTYQSLIYDDLIPWDGRVTPDSIIAQKRFSIRQLYVSVTHDQTPLIRSAQSSRPCRHPLPRPPQCRTQAHLWLLWTARQPVVAGGLISHHGDHDRHHLSQRKACPLHARLRIGCS